MSSLLPVVEADARADVVRFHLSLNIDDLGRSIDFFTVLFDTAPVKRLSDYAKFELAEPPLVLSLEPNRAPRGGKLNHLGFRLADCESLVAMQRRLELKGISTVREDGVECCYARQTKFWVSDPDGNLWEMYTLEEDLDHRGAGRLPEPTIENAAGPARSLWAHRLGEPFPPQIMAESNGVDEVLLEGTFNGQLSSEARRRALAEVMRILKPGGQVMLHQLTALTSLSKRSGTLPGPAAIVDVVPTTEELAAELQAANFVDLYFNTLGDRPCFHVEGVECRETRLVAFKLEPPVQERTFRVLYKGPFRKIEDDCGQTYQRGQWTTVDEPTWRRLQSSMLKEQFALGG